MYTQPYLRERWLFFLALFIFVCGVLLPFYALMNRYFFTARRINPPTVIREAIGTALITDLLLWFQIGRVLTPTIIMIEKTAAIRPDISTRRRWGLPFRNQMVATPPERLFAIMRTTS